MKRPARVRARVRGRVLHGQLLEPPLLPGPNWVLVDHEFPAVLIDAGDIDEETVGEQIMRLVDGFLRLVCWLLLGLGLAVAGIVLAIAVRVDYGPATAVTVLWCWFAACLIALVAQGIRVNWTPVGGGQHG